MSNKKTDVEPAKQAECPAWMMTFGDCMSLLVCFFVMLIAFSNMEEDQLAAMMGAMRGALGGIAQIGEPLQRENHRIEADGLTTVPGESETLQFLTKEEMSDLLPQMISELRLSLRETPTEWPDRLLIRMIDEGLAIVVQTKAIFQNGTAKFIAEDDPLWNGIGGLMYGRSNPIRVVAIVPANTEIITERVRSAWGLGLERAEAVAQKIEDEMKSTSSQVGVGVQIKQGEATESVEITILGSSPPTEQMQQNEWLLEAWR